MNWTIPTETCIQHECLDGEKQTFDLTTECECSEVCYIRRYYILCTKMCTDASYLDVIFLSRTLSVVASEIRNP